MEPKARSCRPFIRIKYATVPPSTRRSRKRNGGFAFDRKQRRRQKGSTPKHTVQARNDLDRQAIELVVLPTPCRDEFVSCNAHRSSVVIGALGSNDRRASLLGNVRHVQCVVEMRVRYQNEISPLNMCVDHSRVSQPAVPKYFSCTRRVSPPCAAPSVRTAAVTIRVR